MIPLLYVILCACSQMVMASALSGQKGALVFVLVNNKKIFICLTVYPEINNLFTMAYYQSISVYSSDYSCSPGVLLSTALSVSKK